MHSRISQQPTLPDAQGDGKILERWELVPHQNQLPPPIPTVPPIHFPNVAFLGTLSFLKQRLAPCK